MFFEKNCNAIGRVDPDLEEKLIKYKDDTDIVEDIQSVLSKDGYSILRIHHDGKWNNLNSIYSFDDDIRRLIDRYGNVNDHAIVVMYGFSNGVVIRELLKRQPSNIMYIVYESQWDIFNYTMHNEDVSDIFESGRVLIYVEGLNSQGLDISLRKYIDETNYRIDMLASLPRYEDMFPKGYCKLQQLFRFAIENCVSDQLTGSHDSKRETRNAIYNLRYIFDCNVGGQFVGSFPTHLPAVIISAGPSLEKNAKLLHRLKGKLLLIAVDTSLPYLLSIGLRPDVAVTVSPNKDTSIKSIYDNPELKNLTFAIDPIVTYTGLEKIAGRRFIYVSSTIPYYKSLFQLGEYEIDSLDNGGSVSTIALSLAAKWGYRQFVLVGQDLAVKKDKRYAGGVTDGSDLSDGLIAINGYYGDTVYTLPDYKLHLDWFEMFARTNPDYTIYNATEGGANITGTDNISLEQVAERYCDEEYNYEEVFRNMPPVFSADKWKELFSIYNGSVERLDILKDKLGDGINKMNHSLELLNEEVGTDDIRILDNQQYIDSVLRLCEENNESFFLERWIGDKQGDILEDIYIEENDKTLEYVRLLQKLKDYFADMRDSVGGVREIYNNMISNAYHDHPELCMTMKKSSPIDNCNVKDDVDSVGDNMNRDVYYKNMQIIKIRYPDIAEKIDNINNGQYDLANTYKLELEQVAAKDGMMITRVIMDGKAQYLNSPYAPMKEAEKFVSQYNEINDYAIMVMCGFGNGIIASELVESMGPHVRFFFYEPSVDIFMNAISNYDLSGLLSNGRFFIFIEGLNSEKFELSLNDVVGESNYRYVYYDALPKYRMLFQDCFSDIQIKYETAVQTVRNNIETQKNENRNIVENNIGNMCFLDNCNCEEEFRGVFPTDIPVVLVAAGPSLEKNCSVLKKIKGKLMIIAVDTALNYLISQGLRPDIVVSVDPHIREKVFEQAKGKNLIYAIASDACNKALARVGNDRKIFITSNSAYYDALFQKAGYHMFSLNNGGSVSTVAFALAQSWGFTQFVLVGQDLAIKGDTRYAGNEDYGLNDPNRWIPVEGYYGDKVYTMPDLKIYLDWYEMIVRAHPDFTIINATEGGARIQGTVKMNLEDIARQYEDVSYDYEKIILEHPPVFAGNVYEEICDYIGGSINRLDEMKQKLSYGKDLLKETELMLINNEKNLTEVKEVNDKVGILLNECDRMYESYYVDCIIADKQGDVMADVYDVANDPKEEYIRVLGKLRSYVEDMIDSIDEVKALFEKVTGKMK